MKVGVISDTHLKQVNNHLKDMCKKYFSDVDMIFHAGDLTSMDIADFLSRQKTLYAVQGNMDNPEVKKNLPSKQVIELEGIRLGLIHGWGAPFGMEKKIRPEFDDVDCIVYGHTHTPVNHTRGGIIFFNPGTACGFRISGKNTVGILEINDKIEGSIFPV